MNIKWFHGLSASLCSAGAFAGWMAGGAFAPQLSRLLSELPGVGQVLAQTEPLNAMLWRIADALSMVAAGSFVLFLGRMYQGRIRRELRDYVQTAIPLVFVGRRSAAALQSERLRSTAATSART